MLLQLWKYKYRAKCWHGIHSWSALLSLRGQLWNVLKCSQLPEAKTGFLAFELYGLSVVEFASLRCLCLMVHVTKGLHACVKQSSMHNCTLSSNAAKPCQYRSYMSTTAQIQATFQNEIILPTQYHTNKYIILCGINFPSILCHDINYPVPVWNSLLN